MERPRFTLKEAADVCSVSLSTIRRRREAGKFPNAVKDDVRGWLIPIEDLLAAGFTVNAPKPPAGGTFPGQRPNEDDAHLAQIRTELEKERRLREKAEGEKHYLQQMIRLQDAHLADMRKTLFALTSGLSEKEPRPPEPQSDAHDHLPDETEQPSEQPRPRRRRLFRWTQ